VISYFIDPTGASAQNTAVAEPTRDPMEHNAANYAPPFHGFRTFFIVWAAQSLSVIGSGMTGFALNVYLSQVLYPRPEMKAELALAFTVLNLGFTIPFVFGGPLAGAWADRQDRKQIMIVTNTINGLITLLTFILMLSGGLRLWMLVSIGVLTAAAGAFHYAAFDASYAMLVPDRLLPRANGMMQTTWSLSGIISPALAAFIIALPVLLPSDVGALAPIVKMSNGTPLVIAIDALTFFLCAVVLLLVHVPSPTRADVDRGGRIEQSVWADIREGALYIWRRPPLLWLLTTFAVANLAGAPTGVIVPLIVKFNLESDWAAHGHTFETTLALLGVASGVGGVIGGLLVSTWGGLKRNRVYGVLVPMLLAGVLQVVYGLSPLVSISAAAASLGAAMHPILNAHSQSIWQSHTPRELQGRVFSIRRLIAWTTLPISTAAAGAFAGVLDPGYVFASLGLIWAVFSTAQLFNPYLLRVDKAALDAAEEQPARATEG
jgi:DHA3 family macrolide efflux protein-like MFS transporter